ncbi:MAG: dihydrodipicolinate synthase family protein, partial [Segetibacter sp.]
MNINWNGVYPALTTKFDSNDQLDLQLFGKNLDVQVSSGINGIILGGTLGESSTLSESEEETLIRFALEKLDRSLPVVINIAEGSTIEAVRQAKLAKKWSADGLMLLPPM